MLLKINSLLNKNKNLFKYKLFSIEKNKNLKKTKINCNRKSNKLKENDFIVNNIKILKNMDIFSVKILNSILIDVVVKIADVLDTNVESIERD